MDSAILVQNIKSYCKAKGVYPTVACAESGAGKSLISQIERRGNIPSVEKMQLLATYLGCTVSDLLGEKKEPTTVPGDGQAEKLAAALRGIGIDVDSLTDADVSRIAKLAKAAFDD